MNYPTVGKTGIQVTNLCFGTMSFGGNADEETSKAMFKRCREMEETHRPLDDLKKHKGKFSILG